MSQPNILTITELTRQIKGVLELGFSDITIQGEISNFKLHSSGHLYFTLKDEKAQISAVMWRSRVSQLLFRPADGMKVIVHGNITVYEPRGNYQIDCVQLHPAGIGELQQTFEKLKQKLLTEGLFDEEHKKPLPEFPQKIGIITSPTGAAIRDMFNILSRRMPALELLLFPVKVQGMGAAEEIAEAIENLNQLNDVDVIIVGRGGGSLEDLWAFNEEIVARAIFDSKIPIISAVGHEVDFCMSDFVADLRAPTPSAAAELVVKDKNELVETLRNFCYTIQQLMNNQIQTKKENVTSLLQSYSFHRPLDTFRQYNQQVDEVTKRLSQLSLHNFRLIEQQTHSLQKRIQALNPQLALQRGYAIVRKDGKIVSSIHDVQKNDKLNVKVKDGEVSVEVKEK